MLQLFSKNSLKILESFSFTKTLYVFDFDGTLSKIVRDPSTAKMTTTTSSLLQQLVQTVPVAIISGRSLNDLKKRIPYKLNYLIGNHGIEGLGNIATTLKETEQVCSIWKNKFEAENFDSGVEIEDKIYSLAIHYRRSRQKKEAKLKIYRSIAELVPEPRVIRGKAVFNLLPEHSPHKGVAILKLMQQENCKHAFYIGDDDTDEDVFSLQDSNIMTVRVGYKKASNAQYYIHRQSEINKLLKLLISYHLKRK